VFPVGLVGLPKLARSLYDRPVRFLPRGEPGPARRVSMRKGVKSQTSDNEDAEEQADTTREKKE
jgi:hypothetical protein